MVLAGFSEISIKQLSFSPFPVAWETLWRWICLGLFGLLGGVSLQQWSLSLPALALCLHGVALQADDSRRLFLQIYASTPTRVQQILCGGETYSHVGGQEQSQRHRKAFISH